jgi:hypothetical protein
MIPQYNMLSMLSFNNRLVCAIALLCLKIVASQSSTTSLPTGAAPTGNETVQSPTSTSDTTTFATAINISLAGKPTFCNASAPFLTINLDYWNVYIGPVEVAAVNTTVSPTPIPSSELVPPPPLHYASFLSGAQNPGLTTNSSWRFPADFWWGVASAAYQVEGAVKDEGRGPSIWDALLHRVVGYSVANQTGDVANNQYYLYKQGKCNLSYHLF